VDQSNLGVEIPWPRVAQCISLHACFRKAGNTGPPPRSAVHIVCRQDPRNRVAWACGWRMTTEALGVQQTRQRIMNEYQKPTSVTWCHCRWLYVPDPEHPTFLSVLFRESFWSELGGGAMNLIPFSDHRSRAPLDSHKPSAA